MFPFQAPHPHSRLTADCHKFVRSSSVCVSVMYDLSQLSLRYITMLSICNRDFNQLHMEANTQTKYDLLLLQYLAGAKVGGVFGQAPGMCYVGLDMSPSVLSLF